jgi:hypothetical protein
VDVRILPGASASGIYVNGQTEGGVLGNGGGTLTSTASLFVGNFSQNNTQNFSGSIYAIKTYLQASTEQPVLNYNATSTRFSKPPVPETAKKRYEILVVAGGGAGGRANEPNYGGGGGAGGLQYINSLAITPGTLTVVVGDGGTENLNGQNSTLGSYVSLGGGCGGTRNGPVDGVSGGSGGGGRAASLGGSGSVGQGNNGGNGTGGGASAGGGGGAGTSGTTFGGSGSFIEAFSSIGGVPLGWFAGGGGGGANTVRVGGIGGGGNGGFSSTPQTTGSTNTGGGGGGGASTVFGAVKGGSGIVAIRYSGVPIALGGEITQSAGFTYHVFRTVGTSSFTIF